MEIHFKSAHTKDVEEEITPEITALAERKLIALKKYLKKVDGITQVYVELGRTTEAHQNGKVWRAQINLDSQGKRYHADSAGEHMKTAVEAAVTEIEVSLRKAKQKDESLFRRGGAAIKSFMQGSKEV